MFPCSYTRRFLAIRRAIVDEKWASLYIKQVLVLSVNIIIVSIMFTSLALKGLVRRLQKSNGKAKEKAKENAAFNEELNAQNLLFMRRPQKSRWAKLRDSKSVSSFVLRSSLGFFGGMLITYVFLLILIVHINVAMYKAAAICSIIGIILPFGLAFSPTARCFTLMTLPQLCSKRGRQLLLGYALVLTLTGPAHNIIMNTRVLSDSLHCGQEHITAAARHLLQIVTRPLLVLRDALKSLLNALREVVHLLHEVLLGIGRALLLIYRALRTAGRWLQRVVFTCNSSLGTPYHRCINALEDVAKECVAALGPHMYRLCVPVAMFESVCIPLKLTDYLCELIEYLHDSVAAEIRKKMSYLGAQIHQLLYVSVDIRHSFKLQTNQSRSMRSVLKELALELETRSSWIIAIFGAMNKAMTLCVLVVFLRVAYYRFMFMTRDHFDNRFITDDFLLLDMKRASTGRETVLPLTTRELKKYIIWWGTFRLSTMERLRRAKALGGTLSTCMKISIFLLADYCLYWLLALINVYGQFKAEMHIPPYFGLHVSGTGVLAKLYRRVVETFEPQGDSWTMDSVPCLPNPLTPDFGRYCQIIGLLTLCLAMAYFEPYALRIRNSVMSFYHPERARERAIWLYNHILRSRYGLLRYLRRQLRSIGGGPGSGAPDRMSCLDWIRARCPWTRFIFGVGRNDCCILCAAPVDAEESSLIRCETPGCNGRFCVSCFNDLGRVCSLCHQPADYGDLSDMSEERGSSDDSSTNVTKKRPVESSFTDNNAETEKEDRNRSKRGRIRHLKRRRKEANVFLQLLTVPQKRTSESSLLLSSSSSSESLPSSELSFSYQYEKSRPETDAVPRFRANRRDPEAGKMDYARESDFDDDCCIFNPC